MSALRTLARLTGNHGLAARRAAWTRPTWRPLSTTLPRRDKEGEEPAVSPRAAEPLAVEETQDVTEMDRLLKTVRSRADPAHHSALPMRSKVLWSEALLRENMPEVPSEKDKSSGSRSSLYSHLEPRSMHDSYCELLLPFASSPELLERYTNAWGGIRTGMLMEHLDSLAGGIAYKHMLGPKSVDLPKNQGFYLVTASVDRLDMLAPLHPVRDMRLSGHVIHTGRSSMEVAVRMEALQKDGTDETILLGRFCMVCRDAVTHKAAPINPLKINTPEDQKLYDMGEAHKNRRQQRAVHALNLVPPTSLEAEALHSLYLQYGQKEESADFDTPEGKRVWMGDTKLEKCIMMFPQERNVHQKVFGGYLMRLAYELGFANASLFTRSHVSFLSLDGIAFAKPVPIGSILRLTAHIIHSAGSEQYPSLVHVGVQANVVDTATGLEQTTNDFRFTWASDSSEKLSRAVVPKTYKEAMLWLEGKRALQLGSEIRTLRRWGP